MPAKQPRTRQGFGRWAKPFGNNPPVMAGITDTEAAKLVELARGRSVLEVGSAWGYSTIVMASVARSLVAVDPHEALQSLDTFRANLEAHGVIDRVVAVVKPSREALPELQAGGRRFELIFIDGDHAQRAVSFDAYWASFLLTPDGVVAFHDYHGLAGDPVTDALAGWGAPDERVEALAVYLGRAQV